MKLKIFRILSLFFLVSWMALIYFLSAQTANESSATSGNLVKWFLDFFYRDFYKLSTSQQTFLYENISFWVRKCAHLSIYFVLGVFSLLSFIGYRNMRLFTRCAVSIFICIAYALSDEWHQTFISGRSGELRDVVIDSAGALLGVFCCLFIVSMSSRLYEKISFCKYKEKSCCKVIGEGEFFDVSEKNLTDSNFEQNNELINLKSENARLCSELAEYKRLCEELKQKNAEILLINNNKPQEQITEKKENVSCKLGLGPHYDYGAECIGRIVRLAAEYSNKLSCGGETKYKELINLILGHTEVEKSNILDIVLSDSNIDDKIRMIDSCEKSAKEYFESVMAQKI